MPGVDSLMLAMSGSPWQMWATLTIIAAAVVAYSNDRLPVEHVSIALLAALLVLFQFAPPRDAAGAPTVGTDDLLAGFADQGLMAILGLLILSQGLFQSGTMELPTKHLMRAVAFSRRAVPTFVLLSALIVSAFVNDTPVVVMFMPIVSAVAAAAKIAPSKVMMPLSFFALLGGQTTLIGSSTNIIAASSYREATGGAEIGFFDLTPMGVAIAAFGVLYMATIGRFLLPNRGLESQEGEREHKQFIVQFEVTRGHFLFGKQSVAGLFPDLPEVTIRMVQRREEAILPPFDEFRFGVGDIVIMAATRATLTELLKRQPEMLEGALAEVELETGSATGPRAQLTMVEAMVPPASRMIGRTIQQIGFHYQSNCVILGIERRSRMVSTRLSAVHLEPGDVLLILGALEDVRALRAGRDVLLLEWSMTGLPASRNALTAGLIFIAVVAASATGLLPIAIAALVGVFAMLVSGCLNIRQAARAFDRRLYLLIGASLTMGLALTETGGAALLGSLLAPIAEAFGPAALLSALFLIAAITTNVLSNNATAVLLMPIGVSAAEIVGLNPLPVALTVIYGATSGYALPIGYQTNLMVMTPGHYKFRDFLIVGGPLLILMWIFYSIVGPIYYRWAGLM